MYKGRTSMIPDNKAPIQSRKFRLYKVSLNYSISGKECIIGKFIA